MTPDDDQPETVAEVAAVLLDELDRCTRERDDARQQVRQFEEMAERLGIDRRHWPTTPLGAEPSDEPSPNGGWAVVAAAVKARNAASSPGGQ